MLNIQYNRIKTHFANILRQVERGQEFAITKHKKIIAKLTPHKTTPADHRKAVQKMKKLHLLAITIDEISEFKRNGRY